MVNEISVTLPDGAVKQVEQGKTVKEFVLEHIGEGLLRAAVAAKVNDEISFVEYNGSLSSALVTQFTSSEKLKSRPNILLLIGSSPIFTF